MYQTKPALPETTRAAAQCGERQGYFPGGSRMASILLSQLQNAPVSKSPSQSSWSTPRFLSLAWV
jgi:hypothetical protein